VTTENPTCANCGRPMDLISARKSAQDEHTFECKVCNLVFMTEDHTPVSGLQHAAN